MTEISMIEIVDRALELAGRYQRPDLIERLRREQDRFDRPTSNVLIVGEFKKGKSSLVNALLNWRVCPVDADVTTAVPTLIRFGSEARAWRVDPVANGDDQPHRQPLRWPEVGAIAADVDHTGRVTSVELELPRALLESGLVLIDTPGVNGGLTAAHAAATLRALTVADAVVFVSDASQEYSAPELEFLRKAVGLCPNLVCVVTKIDAYPEWRRIVDLDVAHLKRIGAANRVLPLAAPVRHYALRTGSADVDEESGYPRLAKLLRDSVVGRKEVLATRTAAVAVIAGLSQIESALQAEQALLADPARTADLIGRLQEAKDRADRLRSAASRWQQTLNDRFGDMISNVDLDLVRRLRGVRTAIGEVVNGGDPAEIWPDLEPWLYERTNSEMVEHHREIHDQADAVATDVAARFDLDAGAEGFSLDDIEIDFPMDQFSVAAPKFQRMSIREATFVAIRGSTSAMVMSSMFGSFTFLAGAPILLPLAPVLAVLLGRKTLRTARETEIKQRRIDAMRSVNSFLEETELVSRKASKDMLRRTNQALRDHFQTRAEELHVTAQRNLEAAARSIKLDRDEAQARLTAVNTELTELVALLDATRAQVGLAAGRKA
jgi:hypothetical protein